MLKEGPARPFHPPDENSMDRRSLPHRWIGGLLLAISAGLAAQEPPKVNLKDWTPPPVEGGTEAWQKATDKDWIDARFQTMDTGPTLAATFSFPHLGQRQMIFRGISIRQPDGGGGVLYDQHQARFVGWWVGRPRSAPRNRPSDRQRPEELGYLTHSDRRFGLLNTPVPAGPIQVGSLPGRGLVTAETRGTQPPPATAPLPDDEVQLIAQERTDQGPRLLFSVAGKGAWHERPEFLTIAETPVLLRHLTPANLEGAGGRSGSGSVRVPKPIGDLLLGQLPDRPSVGKDHLGVVGRWVEEGRTATLIAAFRRGSRTPVMLSAVGVREVRLIDFDPGEACTIALARVEPGRINELMSQLDRLRASPAEPVKPAVDPPTPLVTKGTLGKPEAGVAIDTWTIPYDNPDRALFFVSAVDFLPNGDTIIATTHGDLWTVRDVAGDLSQLQWRRFATGLYHPLGLKVRADGSIVALERGQLTIVRDTNGDGRADRFERLSANWHTGGGEHSYDSCLETDPASGDFHFFKTGDTHTPTGGCLIRVSADGRRTEVFATGFRHPIGMGMSPDGLLTGADQQGNWMPATRLDAYREGGFYGDMRAHHRPTPPTTYDRPLCWIPHEVDNSAGGDVWLPKNRFGPLGGLPVHFSWGRCVALLLLLDHNQGGPRQAGVVELPGWRFLAGPKAGKVHPKDGSIHVAGLNGWQTAAKADGSLQRVRSVGTLPATPIRLETRDQTIRLTFSEPIDPASVTPTSFRLARWNYLWSGEYGSKRYSVSRPGKTGQDDVAIRSTVLEADGKTVVIRPSDLSPAMQMETRWNLRTGAGQPAQGALYHTIHGGD
jgi:hypothetical protein